ncbi:DUF2272 domain-containing protein [Herbaspirillum autotrophicum]|uniref:DUF2272 domain-containing protein n=1 Tax=Herbaspirillum autotrophicum TaxID=180195 RepID=UPI00067AF1AA|nr:DUF2272 domain-containing protein [Herbaspirillum autotrophicum]
MFVQIRRGVAAMLSVFAATLLAACGSPGPAPDKPAQSLAVRPPAIAAAVVEKPPSRTALLAAAETEWAFFDRQQIDMRGEVLSAPRLGLLEDEGEAVQRVGLYWQAVGKNFTGADTQQAWSAAFISYLMQQGGVPQEAFQASDVHFNYLSYLKQRQTLPNPLFVLQPVASTSIVPGDLICAPRESNQATSIDDIRPGLPGHCDLVFEVHPDQGWAGVIGGNVFNSVSESLIPIDSAAHLIPIARRPWFVVAKNLM